jgi:sulfite dehydrogenase (cytochrome) subunit B
MKLASLPVLFVVLALAPVEVLASPISYPLPKETAAFKPGSGVEVLQNNCTVCHFADHISTHPRGAKDEKGFWRAEVSKMIKVYGADPGTPTSPRSSITSLQPIEEAGRSRLAGVERGVEKANSVDLYAKCHRSCEKLRNCHDIGGFWPNPAIV